MLCGLAVGRSGPPSAVLHDGRTVQSTPESGGRGGSDRQQRCTGSRTGPKVHAAVDTVGYLLSVVVTPAPAQERAQVADLAAQVQDITGETVELTYVDAGYTGPDAAAVQGIHLEVVKLDDAHGPQQGFVLLPPAGWSRASVPGWPAFGAWRVTMRACRKRSPGGPSSPASASCCTNSSIFPSVHNTL